MIEKKLSIDISSNTIFRVILISLAFYAVYAVSDILLMIFVAIIIASAINPVADFFQKYKIPRTVTVILIFTLFLLLISGFVTIMIGPLTEQIQQLAQALPQVIAKLDLSHIDQGTFIKASQDTLFKLGDSIANIGVNVLQGTRNFFSGIMAFVVTIIISFYLVVEENSMKKFIKLVTPKRHAAYIERTLDIVQRNMSRWLLAQALLGVIIGVVVGVGLWLMGIKYALLLGIMAGVLEIIPMVGPVISLVFGVAVGLSQSLVLGVAALVFYILVQQVENNLLVPNLMRKAVGLNPLVTIIAVLIGASLGGLVGVILAVPIATIVNVFLSDIFIGAKSSY